MAGERARILTPRGFLNLEGVELFRPDTMLTEDWEASWRLASHPIPRSDNGLDHSYRNQDILTLEGVVTDIDDCNNNTVIQARAGRSRLNEACRILEELGDSAEFLTVTTTFKTHTNMVIESVRAANSKDNRDEFRFVVNLKKFKITNSQNVTLDLPEQLQPAINRGDVATIPISIFDTAQKCPTTTIPPIPFAQVYAPLSDNEILVCRDDLTAKLSAINDEYKDCIDDEISNSGGSEFTTASSVSGLEACYEDAWTAGGGSASFGGSW